MAQAGMPQPESPVELRGTEGPLKREDVPPSLERFTEAVGPFSPDELNEALITIFGEESASWSDDAVLKQESRAIASTIFNRKTRIDQARSDFAQAKSQMEAAAQKEREANKAFQEATRAHDAFAKNPDRLGPDEYQSKLKELKEQYEECRRAWNQATQQLRAAGGAKGGRLRTAEDEIVATLRRLRRVPPSKPNDVRA